MINFQLLLPSSSAFWKASPVERGFWMVNFLSPWKEHVICLIGFGHFVKFPLIELYFVSPLNSIFAQSWVLRRYWNLTLFWRLLTSGDHGWPQMTSRLTFFVNFSSRASFWGIICLLLKNIGIWLFFRDFWPQVTSNDLDISFLKKSGRTNMRRIYTISLSVRHLEIFS